MTTPRKIDERTLNGDTDQTTKPVRVLVAPDKFKGTLTARQVATAIAQGLEESGAVVSELLPLADGGDGSVDAALAAGYAAATITVTDGLGRPVETTVALRGDQAVIEVANICGLGMVAEDDRDALRATSYGVGEAIRHVIALGGRRIVLGLGGSATTDGGAGMLAALGAKFETDSPNMQYPSGGNLFAFSRLDASELALPRGVSLTGASDVTNPLTGPRGAARVFGPQKGASARDVETLDASLTHLVTLAETAGIPEAAPSADAAGAGSAGGLGYATLLLGGQLVSGAGYFLDLLGFAESAARNDLIITGEGSLDGQTQDGKLVDVVTNRAGSLPVIAVVGRSTLNAAQAKALGLTETFALLERTRDDTARNPELSAQLLREIGCELGSKLSSSRPPSAVHAPRGTCS